MCQHENLQLNSVPRMKNVSKGAGEDLLCAYIPDYNDTPWIMALSVSVCERAISVNIFFFFKFCTERVVLLYSRTTLTKVDLQKTHGCVETALFVSALLANNIWKASEKFFMKSRREGRLF